MTAIVDIIGREILDSRGNPTVEVDVVLEDGSLGPCGRALRRLDRRARGGRAARRRQDALPRQGRRSRRSTPSTARSSMRLPAWTPRTSARIDAALIKLDGTPNKSRLGANAILGVSLAVRQGGGRSRAACRSTATSAARRAPAAGADDEHHQRRRACRQPDRHPGVHDHAGRRARRARTPCAWARRSSTRCKKGAEGRRALAPTSATRAALRRTSSRPTRRWASS